MKVVPVRVVDKSKAGGAVGAFANESPTAELVLLDLTDRTLVVVTDKLELVVEELELAIADDDVGDEVEVVVGAE